MSARGILFIGKRRYTGKDAWRERFGRIYQLPAAWARAGEDVRLWLVDYHSREPLDDLDDGLAMRSTPVRGLSVMRAFAAHLRWRPRAVVASGDCYIGLLGWLVARLSGARFVFDIYDKYDEFAGYVRPLGFDLYGFLRRAADLRFFASRALAAGHAADGCEDRTRIVPNGVDPQRFRPLPRAACRERLGLPHDAVLVGYFGGMEADRGVNDLVAAIARLRETGSRARLLVCGHAHPDTPLAQPWIDYRGAVPHERMPDYINACDVVAMPYRSSPFMDMGASCKVAEYLMCGVPLAATASPNFTANFPEQARALGRGLARAADPDSLAGAIEAQLAERVVAPAPEGMAWSEIAAAALEAEGKVASTAMHGNGREPDFHD